jgi:putative ABC transport system permease protein
VVLAGVGMFGVMRHGVEQRGVEIGVRMALGASRSRVLGEVMREGFGLCLAGLVVGLCGSLLLARTTGALAGQLHGVSATDPQTLAAVALLLLTVTGVCLLGTGAADHRRRPERRAAGGVGARRRLPT